MIDISVTRHDGDHIHFRQGHGLLQTAQMIQRALVVRHQGGIGDIIMMRMMLKSIKESFSGVFHFSCPSSMICLVEDHPFVDACISSDEIQNLYNQVLTSSYCFISDVNKACYDHEITMRGNVNKNRSDLWAESIGVTIDDHDPHLFLTSGELDEARKELEKFSNKDVGFIVPKSSSVARDISDDDVQIISDLLRSSNIEPVLIHSKPLNFNGMKHIMTATPRQLFALAAVARCMISADTGPLHAAGTVGLPSIGAFGYTNGNVVCKHYPTVSIMQLDKTELDCVPCYAWDNCYYKKIDNGIFPLRCMRSFKRETWEKAIGDLLEKKPIKRYVEVEKWSSKRCSLYQALRVE